MSGATGTVAAPLSKKRAPPPPTWLAGARLVSTTRIHCCCDLGIREKYWAASRRSFSLMASAIWVLLGLKAFVAAVVGGIGNIRGAMLGGLLIGLLEFFVRAYVPDGTKLCDVFVFGLLVVILLFRPSGILGKTVAEKV